MYNNIENFYQLYNSPLLHEGELKPAKSITRDVIGSILKFIELYQNTSQPIVSKDDVSNFFGITSQSTLSDHLKNMISTGLIINTENRYVFTSDFYLLSTFSNRELIINYLINKLTSIKSISDFTMFTNLIVCTLREGYLYKNILYFDDSFEKFSEKFNLNERIIFCNRVFKLYGFRGQDNNPDNGDYTPNANYRIVSTMMQMGLIVDSNNKLHKSYKLTEQAYAILSILDNNLKSPTKEQEYLDNLGSSLETYFILEQMTKEDETETYIPTIVDIPLPRKEAFSNPRVYVPRDMSFIKIAKQTSNYKCSVDTTHAFFSSRKNGYNYVEAHHIIPLHKQFSFKNSLDVHSNIICLCPICHLKLHNGKIDELIPILHSIFKQREERLINSGLVVDFADLISYYLEES